MFKIDNVDYHITDICNLNCASCNHFCPLVPKSTLHKSMEQIKADLLLLSKFCQSVSKLTLLGGEPTLHPYLGDIIIFARENFPNSEIVVTTNGIKRDVITNILPILNDYNIGINLSGYPFRKNYIYYYETLREELGSRCYDLYFNEQFQTKPFSNSEINEPQTSLQCRMRYCTQLLNGKLYICNYAAQLPYLKGYFGDKVAVKSNNDDFVDLNVCTINDIEFMINSSTPQICNYCKECTRWIDSDMEWIDWHVSQKDINEWIEI